MKLLTVKEVAAILGVSPGTLRNWKCAKRNLQPSLKVGRGLRYYEADVLRFLERCRIDPTLEGRPHSDIPTKTTVASTKLRKVR